MWHDYLVNQPVYLKMFKFRALNIIGAHPILQTQEDCVYVSDGLGTLCYKESPWLLRNRLVV